MTKTFRRGRSTFNCIDCGRLTRETHQSVGADCCYECWEIAGLQNSLWDGYEEGTREEAQRLLQVVQEKGGRIESLLATYPDLLKTPTPETSTKPKGTKTMTNDIITLLARPETRKAFVASALLQAKGKPLTMEVLATEAYGSYDESFRDPIVMILKGIKKAIAVNELPLQVVRDNGTVALVSLAPKKKAPRKSKK